jgi:DNA-binding protein H-NS
MAALKVEKYSDDKLREIRKSIDRELESRKNKERKEIAKQIHELAASIGMTPDELLASGPKTRKRTPVAPKYRDPDTGKTWSGRGRKPAWVAKQLASGKTLDDLAI